MLNNTITLQVDVLANATLVDAPFRRFQEFADRSLYVGDAHSSTTKDTLQFYRTAAKPQGKSRGVQKCAVKLTATQSVPSTINDETILADEIAFLQFNLPVGISPARKLELRQRLIAMLKDDAVMGPLMEIGEI